MWPEIIEDNSSFRGLIYNASANSLIASFMREDFNGNLSEELYFRKLENSTYRKIQIENCHSLRNCMSCANSPLILFNAWMTMQDNSHRGYDWRALISFDLNSGSKTEVLNQSNMPVLHGYQAGWVSSLVSLGTDGSDVVIVAALEKAMNSGLSQVDYILCEYNIQKPSLTPIAKLPNVFF